jgi:pyruvate ferredoxin oxidoreductase alpha subunit
VMVCMDGFILTHAYERVTLPTQAEVDGFLPPFEPRQLLDPSDPVTIGAMVGPEAFTEVKYLGHYKQMQALDRIPEIAGAFEQASGRASGGLLHQYRTHDADTIVVALGSVLGTLQDAVDELRSSGARVGCLGIRTFRPWPAAEVRAALAHADRIVVVEKALSAGLGGIVSQNVASALHGTPARIDTVIAGLGGRAITKLSLRRVIADAISGELQPLTFLDLDRRLVGRELERMLADRRSGPHAENMLSDLGAVASGPV